MPRGVDNLRVPKSGYFSYFHGETRKIILLVHCFFLTILSCLLTDSLKAVWKLVYENKKYKKKQKNTHTTYQEYWLIILPRTYEHTA